MAMELVPVFRPVTLLTPMPLANVVWLYEAQAPVPTAAPVPITYVYPMMTMTYDSPPAPPPPTLTMHPLAVHLWNDVPVHPAVQLPPPAVFVPTPPEPHSAAAAVPEPAVSLHSKTALYMALGWPLSPLARTAQASILARTYTLLVSGPDLLVESLTPELLTAARVSFVSAALHTHVSCTESFQDLLDILQRPRLQRAPSRQRYCDSFLHRTTIHTIHHNVPTTTTATNEKENDKTVMQRDIKTLTAVSEWEEGVSLNERARGHLHEARDHRPLDLPPLIAAYGACDHLHHALVQLDLHLLEYDNRRRVEIHASSSYLPRRDLSVRVRTVLSPTRMVYGATKDICKRVTLIADCRLTGRRHYEDAELDYPPPDYNATDPLHVAMLGHLEAFSCTKTPRAIPLTTHLLITVLQRVSLLQTLPWDSILFATKWSLQGLDRRPAALWSTARQTQS